ncbi:MAG TPA: hypothetical protein VNA20_10815 [Frankiaceae bacterium]|nr:hypothetical protein [Frankiaceae bacterium]
MTRIAALALLLAGLPLAPADAATTTTTWVVERTAPDPERLTVGGGAGVHTGEYAMAAVATADAEPDGALRSAEGVLYVNVAATSDPYVRTPVAGASCTGTPGVSEVCSEWFAGGGLAFAAWWDDPDFDRVFVVLRGAASSVEVTGRGWRLRRWSGETRIAGDDAVSAGVPFAGARAFQQASARGGASGSLALGQLPCDGVGLVGAGAGAAQLTGGAAPVLTTCASAAPAAAVATGATTWTLDGAAAGLADVPARLVVIDAKAR